MLFSSITFLYIFLPIILMLYYIVPNKYKNIVLLIGSLIFYGFETPSFLILILSSILLTYINANLIEKFNNKIVFIFALFCSLTPLFYFKYTNFFIENINAIFKTDINLLKIVLPLGISFYTFQMLSYIVDVKMKRYKSEKNILNLALYVCCFPQLIAGPIVKFEKFRKQLDNKQISINNFSKGILYFSLGLFQKVLIANQLGEYCNLYNYKNTTIISSWFYMICYSLQIYFDFCGYSTMAIGLGKMLGFEFPKNFNYPFIATSIKDFWKRWHMTLSSFFKEYVYIPLGGSRCTKSRNIINLFVVWALTGFWHGAQWNFIIWGLFFFVLLVIEKNITFKINNIIKRITTLLLINISFLIFSSNSLIEMITKIKNLFIGSFYDNISIFYIVNYLFIAIIAIVLSTPFLENIYIKYIKDKKISIIIEPIFIILVLIISTAFLIDDSFNPFLYFRF